jgi:hypothetical protein
MPLLSASQAQKELFHNEALQLLDMAVAAAVETPPQDDPPAAPTEGTCYLVGNAPSGQWAQFPAHLAGYGGGGWRFIAPKLGMAVFVMSTDTVAVYRSSGWDWSTVRALSVEIEQKQVVGPQAEAIADPAGGGIVDAEARLAVSAILTALRHHGLISS